MIARDQLLTVAWLRWRIFVNGLRTKQRAAEAISGVFVTIMMLGFGFGPAIGLGIGTYFAVSTADARFLPLFFWIVFIYWQFVPAISVAVSELFDTTTFLRFPVSLPVYYTLWLAFGSLDPTVLVPILWLCGMFVGASVANPVLLPWAALVLLTFALLNLLLARLLMAYIERWMARRKTREIVGALLAFLGIGIQLATRIFSRYAFEYRNSPVARYALAAQQHLPPAIGARALQNAAHRRLSTALVEWSYIVIYCVAFGSILALRLRQQYRGENLSEAERRGKIEKRERGKPLSRGWLALPDPIGAVFEKEIRTLVGARQLWITLIAPPLMLILFGKFGTSSQSWMHSDLALPIGAAYALFTISSFFCNSFSGEQAGIQFLYLAPVPFRQVMAGKNLAQSLIAIAQFALLLVTVTFFFAPPALPFLALTLAGMIFAIFANLAAGNLLSLYFPKKIDFTRLNRQQGSQVTGLILLGLQLAVLSIAAPIFFAARFLGSPWLGSFAFLVLAIAAYAAYRLVLSHVDSIALRRRELLIAEFTKPA